MKTKRETNKQTAANSTSKTAPKVNKAKEVMAALTERLLQDMQSGANVFEMPFTGKLKGMPKNASSGATYKGMNFWLVLEAAFDSGFIVNKYMTFNQAKDLGLSVQKGAKGLPIVFYKSLKFDDTGALIGREGSGDLAVAKEIPFASLSYVFNVGQLSVSSMLEGRELEKAEAKLKELTGLESDKTLSGEELVIDFKKIGANVETHNVASAHYNANRDLIMMPNVALFQDKSRYWSALAHELIHWTGAESRLDRKSGREFGDYDYKREELVAEFGAAYLMATLNGVYNSQHAAYLKSWSKELEAKDIEYSIREAQKAANYILDALLGEGSLQVEAAKVSEDSSAPAPTEKVKKPRKPKKSVVDKIIEEFIPESITEAAPIAAPAPSLASVYLKHENSYYVDMIGGVIVNVTGDYKKARKFSSIEEAETYAKKERILMRGFKPVEIMDSVA